MKIYIVFAIAVLFFGCNDEYVITSHDNTVHLAGFLGTPDGLSVAGYWRDGAHTNLTHDTIYSQATSLHIDRSSVLIGGWKWRNGLPPQSVIWQGMEETVIENSFGGPLIASQDRNVVGVWNDLSTGWIIKNGSNFQPLIDTALNIWPTAMALLDDDVYISGCSSGSGSDQYAQCWKNGNLIFREEQLSNAMSIFVHENDIYMAGYVYNTGWTNGIACYWKNGERVSLTDGSLAAVAMSIFVTDAHVYVSGMINDQAVYWTDGEAVALTTEGTFSMANCIFVSGTDIHVAGYQHGYPAYWKNNVKQNIENQETRGQIKYMVVGSN
jgi:hypothetical protein